MTKKQTGNLTLFQLSILIWTLTCAGPFGIEEAVQSAGVFYTFIGLMVTPFVFSLPQALMCSELGSMMPSHHGYIIWVYRAFDNNSYIGNFIGFFNSISNVIEMGLDIPIYTVLMSYYFELFITSYFPHFVFTFWTSYFFKLAMVAIGAIFNIFNITTLGNSSIIFSVVILLPFLIGFSYAIPDINIKTWLDTKPYNDSGEHQWALFASAMIWLHCGWDSVGSLTAELNFPKSQIFMCFVFGIVLDYISYTIPIMGAVTVPCAASDQCWDNGYLYTVYDEIIPKLGIFVVISGFLCNFGLYIAELAVQSRTFWALSQPKVLLLQSGEMIVEGHSQKYYDDDMNIVNISDYYINPEFQHSNSLTDTDTESDTAHLKEYPSNMEKDLITKTIRIGIFPECVCGTKWDKTGAPVRGVLLQSVISAILILFDFETLLEGTILVACVTWFFEFLSFLILRYTEADAPRPFKVPGGMCLAWLITIDKMILVSVLTVLILYESAYYLYLLCGYFILVMVWYAVYVCMNHKNVQSAQDDLDNSDEVQV